MNVDFQKQTVDPMQVSFNTLDRPRTVADLLLTIDVTEVRVAHSVLEPFPLSCLKILVVQQAHHVPCEPAPRGECGWAGMAVLAKVACR